MIRRSWIPGLIAIAIAACGGDTSVLTPANATLARELSGRWSVTLSLSASPLLAVDSGHATALSGEIVLLPNAPIPERYSGLAVVTDYGSYDFEFSSFGFDSPEKGRPPGVIAGPFGHDSIVIVLSPNQNAVELALRGTLSGDSVTGKWTVAFPRAGAGGGPFVMVREK